MFCGQVSYAMQWFRLHNVIVGNAFKRWNIREHYHDVEQFPYPGELGYTIDLVQA